MKEERETHYSALGLDRRCTAADVRDAYRLLVKRHHPDLNQQSPEAVRRSQRLNEAHEVLSDPRRRRDYDRDLDESRSRTSRSGKIERNISQDVNLRIEDFFRGVALEVSVKDPSNPETELYHLAVPAMTAPGARFRLPRNPPFTGGFVVLRVRALPGFRFKARGSDLRCDLRIEPRLAAEGGTQMLPGPTGVQLRLTIPARTGRGEILRIAGEGLPRARGARGDLLVRVTYRPEVRVSRAR